MSEELTPIRLGSQPATEEQKAWHVYLRSSLQEEPKRLEEAAKFLSGMVSITFTILLSANKEILKGGDAGLLAISAVAWLIALLLAFGVLYPMPYRTVKDSAEAIGQMHNRVVRNKTYLLAGAVLAYVLGLVLLLVVYLGAIL